MFNAYDELNGKQINPTANHRYQAVVFRCASEAQKKALLDETHYEIVGPYLVQRHRTELGVWVTKLGNDQGYF